MNDPLNKAIARLPFTRTDAGDAEYDDTDNDDELTEYDESDFNLDNTENANEIEMEDPIGIDEDYDDIDEDYDDIEEVNFDE